MATTQKIFGQRDWRYTKRGNQTNKKLTGLIARLQIYQDRLNINANKLIELNADNILDFVRLQQLYRLGENAFEERIFSYMPYAESTQKRKKAAGEAPNKVTLHKTGKFYNSLHVQVYDDGFEIVSDDTKAEDLIAKYGKSVIRLSPYYLSLVQDTIELTFKSLLMDYIEASNEAEIQNKEAIRFAEAEQRINEYVELTTGLTYQEYFARGARIKPNKNF